MPKNFCIPFYGKITAFLFLLLMNVQLTLDAQTIRHWLRHNFTGFFDLSREVTLDDIRTISGTAYRTSYLTNVTGTAGNNPRIMPRRTSNGNEDGLWKCPEDITLGDPYSYPFYSQFSLPATRSTFIRENITPGYSYYFKLEANTNPAKGILMEFDRPASFIFRDVNVNYLYCVPLNTPATGTVSMFDPIASGQHFMVRYRFNSDPVGVFSWTEVNFPAPGSIYGWFTLPAYTLPGTVSYRVYCKNKPLAELTPSMRTDPIYDIMSPTDEKTYTVSNSDVGDLTSEFSVNMTGQTVSSNGVYLFISELNQTQFAAIRMTNTGNNVYKVNLRTKPNATYSYLFGNGIVNETPPALCANATTRIRQFVTSVANPSPPIVCFSACNNACSGSSPLVNVTFRVNATGTTVSPQGVRLAGSFNNFSPTATPMTNTGNNIYEATVPLNIGELVTYRFVNGNTFETVPFGCGITDLSGNRNRFFTTPTSNTTLSTVCFNSCTNSCSGSINTTNITFRVNMTGQTVSPSGIKLAGTFNGFSTTATPMTAIGNNVYEVTVPLATGSTVQYKFVNGNTFELISTDCGVNDGGGNINRFIQVPSGNSVLNTVCFGSCDNSCSSVTNSNITFRVNMSGQTISPQGVKLAGSFNGFSTTATPMAAVGNNVYEATISAVAGSLLTYKFVNGNTFELISNTCGIDDGAGNINRFVNVPSTNTTLGTVCFNSCVNTCTSNATSTNVTFRVNMTGQTVSPQGVKLAGTFNGFSVTANPMTLIGNNIYETTIALPFNSTFQYKFVNGTTFELISTACGVNDGGGNINRLVSTSQISSEVIPAVCFGSCADCDVSQITFRVNMGTTSVDPSGVFLAGSFNNFSTTANPMINIGNNIWITTLPLQQATQVTYKFVNSSTFELITAECGIMGGASVYDRVLTVPGVNTLLGNVCFNSCNACVNTSIIEPIVISGGLYPNPASNTLFFKKPQKGNYTISDVSGRVVASGFSAGFISSINISALLPGMYFIRIMDKKEMQVMKFIKQ